MSEVPRRIGIDVSRWQGVVFWPSLPPAGIEFGYVKATHGLGEDTSFAANWQASHGTMPRGAYHWLTDQDAVLQAEHLVRTLEATGDLGELFPAVDFEEPTTQFRGAALLIHLLRCLRRVRELTGGVVMYSGRWYLDSFVALEDGPLIEELVQIPYWHAEYARTEIADKRACGLRPPSWPAPRLPRAWSKRGIAQAIHQADGDGGCTLPNGADADFNVATTEGLALCTRPGHKPTDPAPALDDGPISTPTTPGTPIAISKSQPRLTALTAPIIDADDGRAVTPLRAGEPEYEPPDAA